jgi:hypothetical protein
VRVARVILDRPADSGCLERHLDISTYTQSCEAEHIIIRSLRITVQWSSVRFNTLYTN